MGRYRKVDVRVWDDLKFRKLSPIKPCGQALWLYLLTNWHTTSIPGLYRLSEAEAADELGWPIVSLRAAWREVAGQGLAQADWQARVVWLPNALKYNEPESPSVAVGWTKASGEIPPCELKTKAIQSLVAYLESRGSGWAQAAGRLRAGCPAGCPVGVPHQEQEQEQEQEKLHAQSPQADSTPVVLHLDLIPRDGQFGITETLIEEWSAAYPGVDVIAELRKACQWAKDNPTRRKTAKGARAFLGGWLGRVQNKSPGFHQAPQQQTVLMPYHLPLTEEENNRRIAESERRWLAAHPEEAVNV